MRVTLNYRVTPGLWRYDENLDAGTREIYSDWEGARSILAIATPKAMQGDAALMAGAPELLRAVRVLLPFAQRYLDSIDVDKAPDDLAAAANDCDLALSTARAALRRCGQGALR